MHATLPLLNTHAFPPIRRRALETLQVNLGYRCNQACLHCHVAAGPTRREMIDRETADLVLDFLRRTGVETLDLTGGAPEMNPNFRHLTVAARGLGIRVIDRCNLTVLEEPGYDDLAEFLAQQGVQVIASLPCHLEQNVDRQRGAGVFAKSVRALGRLNELGYGRDGSGLVLNLVYNPQGASLPPAQATLEAAYRSTLRERYGIVFTRLYVLANMPIQRFGSTLVSEGRLDDYLNLLRGAHRPENLEHVMCRSLLSVDWQGYVYDCDFNQMLGLGLGARAEPRTHLRDLLDVTLSGASIRVAGHCYGCTAGAGSSCGGALGRGA